MKYVIYDKTGTILRQVQCSESMGRIQAKENEFIMQGTANDRYQKIVDGKIVNKSPDEIVRDNPETEIPKEKRARVISNEQWDGIMARIESLESEAKNERTKRE